MKSNNLYISKGSKPVWKLVFPALSFTLALYIAYHSYTNYSPSEFTTNSGAIVVAVSLIMPLIILGIVFSMVKDFYFDFGNKRYKIVKRVGPIGFGRWKNFESLEYLSVSENLDTLYELNLWYNGNKHFSIDVFSNKKDAIDVGKDIVANLSIELHISESNYSHSEEDEYIEIPREQRNIDAHISIGKRPIWQIIIAAAFFTGTLVSLYFFYKTMNVDVENRKLVIYFDILQVTAILFFAGVSFSVVKDYQFDFKNKQYKIVYRVGPIKYGQWEPIKSLNYVSIFRKNERKYEVNLWYNTNKHFNLSIYQNFEEAIQAGKVLGNKLKIDVLDASDPHNSKWIDNLNP